ELRESDESNSNSEEEISDNDLEPEISTTLRRNRRGRPRLTQTSQGSNNNLSHKEIEFAAHNQDTVLEQQEQDIDMLVVDLTSQNSDPEIENQLNAYLDLNNLHILTEEMLDDSEIIEVVLNEANQYEHGDPDDSDEEEPEISILEGLMGLNKFIGFFEQQTDPGFKAEDLKIFQKYLALRHDVGDLDNNIIRRIIIV
ncbi:3099_t:CDS:2, partial [Cetraspora pellucida]